ncbi:MAG: cytochrome c3 family protein [Granulosicoccaceae bacterium]
MGWKKAIGGVVGVGLVMTLGWLVFDTTFHLTGDYEFCTSCHSHKPIGTSYRADLHGGNNSSGWRATCSQCHISHKSSFHYLFVKGVHGVVDPTMEVLKDSYDIDWHGHREKRAEYTFDSGCLSCHKLLATQTLANTRAVLPHRDYFRALDNGKEVRPCVECHEHVGHKNLGQHLEQAGWHQQDVNIIGSD